MNNRGLKAYVFCCSSSLDRDQIAGSGHGRDGDTIKTISLPCSGKVDVPYLVKAFEAGADGVVIVTCKKNECCHLEGNVRAHKRAEAVDALLDEIGAGKGRMAVIDIKDGGVEGALVEIKEFFDGIRNLPPLPA